MTQFSKDHKIRPEILRAYDIRGIYGNTLIDQDAWFIGIAFGHYVRTHGGESVAVLRDGRLSSPPLAKALIQGLRESGVNVLDLGLGPTPLLYFGVETLNVAGGIMITGSHNPGDHNGFKLCLKSGPFYGQNIQDLPIFFSKALEEFPQIGALTSVDLVDAYVERLAQEMNPQLLASKKLHIVWDTGSGATGQVVKKLAGHIPAKHQFLNLEIDGTFPSHHPDPNDPETLNELIQTVLDSQATIGIAFDGDGDRLGAVDSKGRILSAEDLMLLFSEDVLKNAPQGKIIYDIKTTNGVRDKVLELGGQPILWKTGHATIKAKIAEVGAVFAGEVSGHMFFKDRYYGYDDGLYAAVRLLNIVSKNPQWSGFKDLEPRYFQTPEITIPCPNDRKFLVVKKIGDKLKQQGIPYIDIDGVKVGTPDGWWLIRASNTQDLIMMRAEAMSQEKLQKLKQQMETYLKESV